MKLTFILLLFASTLYAQRDSTFSFDQKAWHKNSAFEYAKGGMILICAADALAIYFIDKNFEKSTFLFPIGIGVAGFTMLGISIGHTIKYRKLNNSKVELSFKDGLGIIYRFN